MITSIRVGAARTTAEALTRNLYDESYWSGIPTTEKRQAVHRRSSAGGGGRETT